MPVYRSYFIENYPNDLDKILSDDGFGKNDYVETHKKLILVSAPGASSGKFETGKCNKKGLHGKQVETIHHCEG